MSITIANPNSSERNPGRILIFAGATVALYLAFFLLLQSHSLWERPTLIADRWPDVFGPIRDLFPQEWIQATRESALGLLNSFLYLSILGALFTTYLLAAGWVFRSGLSAVRTSHALQIIVWVTALVLVILLCVPGSFTSDVFSYIYYGKIWSHYADNPLINYPSQYTWYDTSDWLQYIHWKDTPSTYGPAWLFIAGAIAWVARALDNDIVTHLMGHRLLATVAHLANVWLIWRVAGHVVGRYWRWEDIPESDEKDSRIKAARLGVALLYAWNPLLLIEFGANGHNDVSVLTCLLAALLLHLRGQWRWAVGVLALACLIKASALFFLPGYLWLLFWEWRGDTGAPTTRPFGGLAIRLSRLTQSLGIIALVWVAIYWPFWEGTRSLQAMTGGPPTRFFIHSLGTIIRFRLPEWFAEMAAAGGWQPPHKWTSDEIGWRLDWPARWGPLAITYTIAVFQTIFARQFPRMVVAWCWVLLTYLTIGSVWFWPWYVPLLIVPAALIGPGRILTATHVLSASSLTIYAFSPEAAPPFDWLPDWTGVLVAVPPLLYLAFAYAGDWFKSHSKRNNH